MGMYTTYSIDATLKPQYREQFAKLYDIDGFGRFHLLRWNSKKPKSNF